jgi:PadR family transcriptional regulator, regulatory protein PadR
MKTDKLRPDKLRPDKLKGHLDLLLLEILADGPAHGYAVITSLRDRTDGTFDLPEGTVYPALHRFEDAGLLASDWDTRSGRRRRIYRLTPRGRGVLADERRQWSRFATAVDAVLRGPVIVATPAVVTP